MYHATLRGRAAMFAMHAGAVAFVLSLIATARGAMTGAGYVLALALALLCAILSSAAARGRIGDHADAIDAAIDRLAAAAAGDLSAPVPSSTARVMPRLARAMDGLFEQLRFSFGRVEHLALFDPVTGLPNRASFRTSADALLASLDGGSAALFFIDLDRFKDVNDTRGHACGDQLLARVAERLQAVAARGPAGTITGRLAGDEFTMLCPGLDDHAGAARIGAAILATLAESFPLAEGPVSIGASIGVASHPRHGATLTELMRAADAAMYQAKERGRGQVTHYDARLAAELDGRDKLDSELRDAIERGDFALVFQPQLRLGDGALVAAEALLRWRHPVQGLRPAGDFLGRAEMNGQMFAIGDWIVRSAAAVIADWEAIGQPGRLALNISLRQLEDPHFLDRLRGQMADAGAPLHRLELELAESVALACAPGAIETLGALRRAGMVVTIDDFGAGPTNLQRLRVMPVDRVKLDRGLVRDVVGDPAARTVLQAMIGLAQGFGCDVIASGVETPAQMEVLRVLGCDSVQGYAVARPLDADTLAAWTAMPGRAAVLARA